MKHQAAPKHNDFPVVFFRIGNNPTLARLAEHFKTENDHNVDTRRYDNPVQVVQLLKHAGQGIIFFQVTSKAELSEMIQILTQLEPMIVEGSVRVVGFCFMVHRGADLLMLNRCTEVFETNISFRSLKTKFLHWHRFIQEHRPQRDHSQDGDATMVKGNKVEKPLFQFARSRVDHSDFEHLVSAYEDILKPLKTTLRIQKSHTIHVAKRIIDIYEGDLTLEFDGEFLKNDDHVDVHFELIQDKTKTAFSFPGKVVAVEDIGGGHFYVNLTVDDFSGFKFRKFIEAFSVRQNLINGFLKDSKGA